MRTFDAEVPTSCRGARRTELRLAASAPASARLSTHVKPWFLAATLQMEDLRSYGYDDDDDDEMSRNVLQRKASP